MSSDGAEHEFKRTTTVEYPNDDDVRFFECTCGREFILNDESLEEPTDCPWRSLETESDRND